MATTSKLSRFSPPAFLKDLKSENLQGWSDVISGYMQDEITGAARPPPDGKPLTQFFDGTITAYDISADHKNITWVGFPKRIQTAFGNDEARWKEAEKTRNNQDEYLEWSVLRDNKSNITSVTFTCEGPEYWDYLVEKQPEDAFAIIKSMNSPLLDKSKMEDFFTKGSGGKWSYNKNNSYNRTTVGGTIINLWQPNNTLGAEIDIAAQGTVIRKMNNKIVTDQTQLIECSQYGDPGRNSDPVIGGSINGLARQGWTLSVADPVALYMHSFNTTDLSLDTSGNRDGTNKDSIPDSWIEVQRGKDLNGTIPLALRVRIRNNTGAKTADGSRLLDVSDIWDDSSSSNIRYGSQFADHIIMGVAGVVGVQGKAPTINDAQPCIGSFAKATIVSSASHAHQNTRRSRVSTQ